MKKQLIHFRKSEHQREVHQAKQKLSSWENVQNEVQKLIELPKNEEDFNNLLNEPLQYVKQTLDNIHRPKLNLPLTTDKILDLLEIDLSPLIASIEKYNSYRGQLVYDLKNGVEYLVDKEKYCEYAETEKQIERLNKAQSLIKAVKDIMGNEAITWYHLSRLTNNKVNLDGLDIAVNPYWIKN